MSMGLPHTPRTAVKRVKPKKALKVLERDTLRSTVCLFLERSENISPGENNLFIYLIFFHESTALYTITFVNSQSRTRSTRVQNRIRTSLQPLVRHRFSTLGRFKSRILYFALREVIIELLKESGDKLDQVRLSRRKSVLDYSHPQLILYNIKMMFPFVPMGSPSYEANVVSPSERGQNPRDKFV